MVDMSSQALDVDPSLFHILDSLTGLKGLTNGCDLIERFCQILCPHWDTLTDTLNLI